ncbi:MAG: DNA alkylation repair protein [Coxiellaceae bacterium]|jgi:3-methyladenine DNA glycosylase AlkD|nr:DNA alkylation repair protein [Coxiellaceae bacterium]
MSLLKDLCRDLHQLASPANAIVLQRFFKTGPGEYGYGDKFLGVTVPKQRLLAKDYHESLQLKDLRFLLKSKLHEERLLALLILVLKYNKASLADQRKIYDFYFTMIAGINSWDLVDLSAPYIVGAYLFDKEKSFLHELIRSKNLWQRRIAIVSTLYFIRKHFYQETLKLAKKLLHDDEDLIYKATGWMLREVGKCDFAILNNFLSRYCRVMPRIMLKYAIERFPEKLRQFYLYSRV